MKNLTEISKLIEDCIQAGFELPLSGNFDTSDVIPLVKRKISMQKLYKKLFGNYDIEEYIAEHQDWTTDTFGADAKIYISDSPSGFRFSGKSSWYLNCEITTESTLYRLTIPLFLDNIELMFQGIVSLTDPAHVFEWTEYGFSTSSHHLKKETKLVLKFNQSRNHEILTESNLFWFYRLEDSAILALAQFNMHRVSSQFPDLKVDLHLLREWSKMIIDCHNQNVLETIKPLYLITIDQEWRENFENFMHWSMKNGYSQNSALIRNNELDHYSPSNCAWKDNITTFSSENAITTVDVFPLPERYYLNPKDLTYYSLSSILNTPITVGDVTKSVYNWQMDSGIPAYIIMSRKHEGNTNQELLKPIKKIVHVYTNKKISINGVSKTAKEWSNETGISIKTIISRIKYGWDEDDLLIQPGHHKRKSKDNL